MVIVIMCSSSDDGRDSSIMAQTGQAAARIALAVP
jgi:hypothetical protein